MFRKLAAALMAAGGLSMALAAPSAAASGPVQSCADVRAANPSAADGAYTIYPNKHILNVYCANMASSPAEYLTLQNSGGSFNFSQMTGGGAIPSGNLVTHFTKIRIDPSTMVVNTGDFAFSSSSGSQRGLTQLALGVAADCNSPNSHTGVANIDLNGLPFQIAESFRIGGFVPNGSTSFSNSNQTVNLTGGGFCGWNAEASQPDEFSVYHGGAYLHLTFTGVTDTTPPAITFSGNAGSYTVDQTVIISCSTTDSQSGVASSTCANVNAPAYTFALGANQLSATATDNAGNIGTGSTSFTVTVSAASLDNLAAQLVSDASILHAVQAHIDSIVSAPNANAKAGKLNSFSNFLSAQTGKGLSQQSAATLARLASAL